MVLGSQTGESPYIPRVTEEREILSKIDSADGNLVSRLKDDIAKILEIHKRLANNEGFILSGDQTDDIMKKHLNVFYDTKNISIKSLVAYQVQIHLPNIFKNVRRKQKIF